MNEVLTKNAENKAKDGFEVLSAPIGREAVTKAYGILQKYKSGKTNLNRRIISNEEWYRLRHWGEFEKKADTAVEPVSAWLFNCICNKHADAMDNFPSVNVLPREEGDKGEAEMLSSILPVILEQNGFEKTYSDCWDDKLRSGTAVYGVFWDPAKLNGLGDVTVSCVDVLNLYWEPGITDIEDSANVFNVALVDNEALLSRYPFLEGKLGGSTDTVAEYVYDDTVDTSGKTAVIDWYYKKRELSGKTVLHLCKFAANEVLYATENDPALAGTGLYAHGRYPFIFDTLFSVKGSLAGFGYIDVGKSAQEYIDKGNQAIMENLLANASPRYFVKEESGINTDEFADMSKRFVTVAGGGNLEDRIKPIDGKHLDGVYVNVILNKIEELKETTGNRDISSGGTSGGVTAASAVAALQEAGSKLSRDHNKASYRVFREVCLTVIELVRQFYTLPRCFRIIGENGKARFIRYSNADIMPQSFSALDGDGYRLPVFDIFVSAQKQSPYSKMAQNELALQFYNAGFFKPELAAEALSCLDMMDFERKEFIRSRIEEQLRYSEEVRVNSEEEDLSVARRGVAPATRAQRVTERFSTAEPARVRAARQRAEEVAEPK